MTHQPMLGKQRWGLTFAAAATAVLAPTAPRAVEITAGDWKFTASGNVNAEYIMSRCEENPAIVVGGLACTVLPGADRESSTVSNGLLPAALAISASTTQAGYDISVNFGLFPGISTNDGGSPNLQTGESNTNTGLGSAGLDVRQVYLTFGNDRMGTILAGRNIGLFQQDAILNDMTLLGVGASANNAAPTNTTLGSIGLGYIYPDWLAQLNYTTPSFFGGLKLTAGVFDPLEPLGATPTPKSSPGVHAKAAYTLSGFLGGDLYLSAAGLWQKQKGLLEPQDFDSWAFDVGGKFKWQNLEVLGWYYDGKGVGTTALFFNASDGLGRARRSDGFLAQVTYTIKNTKLGFNYGQSNLDTADGELPNPTLVGTNSKYTAGVYHKLTDNLTLLAEGTQTTAKAQNDAENKMWTWNVGAFLAF